MKFSKLQNLTFSFELLTEGSEDARVSADGFTKWMSSDAVVFHLGLSTATKNDINWEHYRYFGQTFVPEKEYITGVRIPLNLTLGDAIIHLEIRQTVNGEALFSTEIPFFSANGNDLVPIMVYNQTEPPSKIERQHIDRYALYLVTGGRGRYRSEWVTAELTPGVIFFGLNGKRYEIENTDHLQYMSIEFYGIQANQLLAKIGCSGYHSVFYGYEHLIPFWKNGMEYLTDKNVTMLIPSILLYTFSILTYQKEPTHDPFRNVINYLDNHCNKHDLTLTVLAEACGYNPRYLSGLFIKKMGVGFSDYLTNARIQHALRLIDQGLTSVKNVAWLSGYRDPLYFSKVFKKQLGIAPKEYIGSKLNHT